MLHMFFGDSHSRQFKAESAWGNFSYNSFSGATIKGLINPKSKTGHGPIITYSAFAPFDKSIFLMFGQVDLDFRLYRNAYQHPDFSPHVFIAETANTYAQFVKSISILPSIDVLCILAPQPSPLNDEVFARVLSKNAKLAEEQILSLAKRLDLGHRARIQHAIKFADLLQDRFSGSRKIKVYRIDDEMVDGSGAFSKAFLPKKLDDHHANPKATLQSWARHLGHHIPWFAREPRKAEAKPPQVAALHSVLRPLPPAHDIPESGGGTIRMAVQSGGWCWYQDARAISQSGKILLCSVAGETAAGHSGSVCVTAFAVDGGGADTYVLASGMALNDHNTPSMLRVNDEEFLIAFSVHNGSTIFVRKCRIVDRELKIVSSFDIRTADRLTYCNLIQAGREIYLFHRGQGWNPNFFISQDAGDTFAYGGKLLEWSADKKHPKATGNGGGGRPYVIYRKAPDGSVHFIATEDHPCAYATSLYHGVIRDGDVLSSDGNRLTALRAPISPTQLSLIYSGDKDRTVFPCDFQIDGHGNISVLFSVKLDGGPASGHPTGGFGGLDQRYYHAFWNGECWNAEEIARAGTYFTSKYRDFCGLAAVNPRNLHDIVISCNVDTKTGEPFDPEVPASRYRLFRRNLRTEADWTRLTDPPNGQLDIRPIFVQNREEQFIAWMRGTYKDFRRYNTAILLMPLRQYIHDLNSRSIGLRERAIEMTDTTSQVEWLIRPT